MSTATPGRPGPPLALIGLAAGFVVVVGGLVGVAVGFHRAAPAPKAPPRLTADQLVAAGKSTLDSTPSYQVTVVTGSEKLVFAVQDDSTFRADGTEGATGKFSAVAIDGRYYLKANAAFWRQAKAPAFVTYADRWLLLPQGTDVKALQVGQKLRTSLDCVLSHAGPLRLGPDATLDGQPVHHVVAGGTAPGTAPVDYAIAATGPAYLVRLAVTGTRAPGSANACPDGYAVFPTAASDEVSFDFSNWGATMQVGVPPEPVKLSRS